MKLRDLIADERGKLSSARCGLWATVLVTISVIYIDVGLTLHQAKVYIPNTVYAVLGTMFTVFAAWAAGPRIAQYIGGQVGQVATGIAAAVRQKFVPNQWKTGDPDEGIL